MKYVSIRNPETGPLGETFLDASVLAMVEASSVKRPGGGCLESVLTPAIHRPELLGRLVVSRLWVVISIAPVIAPLFGLPS
jgi:hypothetical protein